MTIDAAMGKPERPVVWMLMLLTGVVRGHQDDPAAVLALPADCRAGSGSCFRQRLFVLAGTGALR